MTFSEPRLLIVSNRLPVTVTRNADGLWQYSLSSGGLVSALGGLKKLRSFLWIGWPGEAFLNDSIVD